MSINVFRASSFFEHFRCQSAPLVLVKFLYSQRGSNEQSAVGRGHGRVRFTNS